MRRIAVTSLIWLLLAGLATTWIGALFSFGVASIAIILLGALAFPLEAISGMQAASGDRLLLVAWGASVAVASALLASAAWTRSPQRGARAGVMLVSLIGLPSVVLLSIETMSSSWP
jgi:hypothetical protein